MFGAIRGDDAVINNAATYCTQRNPNQHIEAQNPFSAIPLFLLTQHANQIAYANLIAHLE